MGRVFFSGPSESCIEITPAIVELGKFSETIGESKAVAALLARHNKWQERLPEMAELWDWLERMEQSERLELLAYCTSVTVNAVYDRYPGRNRLMSADALARAISLDMADWWRPTQAGFLDRVTKDQIVQAVTEGVSVQAARYLPDLKKSQMSAKAEKLLAESRWLPEALRTSMPDRESVNEAPVAAAGE